MLVDVVKTKQGQPMPRSLYAELPAGHSALALLDHDLTAEIAIVGAGYTGLATALHLAKLGRSCVVLEANDIGWGASGRNGGQINPGLKLGPDAVARDLGTEAIRFSHSAADRVFEIVAEYGIECDIRRGGTLRAAVDAPSLAQLDNLAAQLGRHGINARMMTAAGMAAATGTERYTGGLFDPAGGQLNPLKFVRGLAQAAIKRGVQVFTNSPVLSAVKENGNWQLKTPAGRVRADRVLFATNGYTGPLVPRLRRSLLPVFSSIIASRPMPEQLAVRILGDGQSLFEVGPVTTYYRVDSERRLVFGGRGTMHDADGPDAFPSIRHYAEQLWPELRAVGWEYGWNGRVALTSNHYLHLHRIEETGLACVGYNGRGVAMATAMGQELARMLVNDGHHRPAFPVTPIKTIAFQPCWPLGVVPALAWAQLRARLAR